MATVSFTEGRACVLREVLAGRVLPVIEYVSFSEAAGRVLAEDVVADRDYPPVARSVRDGFAIRAADAGPARRVIGEVRAGQSFDGVVGSGEAVEIMTGAPMPAGADAVVMVEHVRRDGDMIHIEKPAAQGDNFNPGGAEAAKGTPVIARGRRIDYAGVAMLATTGLTRVPVYRKPSVAILATGDEIVPVETAAPASCQIRNSNAWSVAAQVARAGGAPEVLPVAPDRYEATRELMERGLASDLLLISGGVSAGKYDIVERVLADLGAGFFFDRVRIQPGQPLVFGRARGTFFFGLPGNPVSTMVTFEIFARAALELLSGQDESVLPLAAARLTAPFRHRTGLTRFLPATLNGDGTITHVRWAGSSDVVAATRANAFLVADPDREYYQAGDWIGVLPK